VIELDAKIAALKPEAEKVTELKSHKAALAKEKRVLQTELVKLHAKADQLQILETRFSELSTERGTLQVVPLSFI
jgi:hypothetical protein